MLFHSALCCGKLIHRGYLNGSLSSSPPVEFGRRKTLAGDLKIGWSFLYSCSPWVLITVLSCVPCSRVRNSSLLLLVSGYSTIPHCFPKTSPCTFLKKSFLLKSHQLSSLSMPFLILLGSWMLCQLNCHSPWSLVFFSLKVFLFGILINHILMLFQLWKNKKPKNHSARKRKTNTVC